MTCGIRRGAIFVASLALAACGGEPAPHAAAPQPALATLTVTAAAAPSVETWSGRVEAIDVTTLSAQTNARVAALPVDVGDRVQRGDVLVQFTAVEQDSARRAAAAAASAARAEARNANTEWQRARDVFARGLIARTQLDAATTRRDATAATLRAAEAELQRVGQQAGYTTVRAPFDGVITARFVEVGESVQSGPPVPQPLLALAATDALRVALHVPQASATAIRAEHRATIRAADGRQWSSDAVNVFPTADPVTHTFTVRVPLPTATRGLPPGSTVGVDFVVGRAARIELPPTSLVQRGELVAAYVVGADGVPTLRQLRIGQHAADVVAVLAGLTAGERVARDPDAAAAWLAARHRAARD